jgi:hypothetical protein
MKSSCELILTLDAIALDRTDFHIGPMVASSVMICDNNLECGL